ncbi:MAG: thioredoxin-dependent thiol peroxidase [Acidobacteria bacterium]|jgi:peroxiredoxin Q/BCP|nr:thioredoxin-dependent thiol peroxidase [Acidobacteriota bacterium]
MFAEGDIAPDFTARDQTGADVKLSDLRGRRVVLYFYPKDDTPGCTKQACSLRDGFSAFEEKNIKVLGVSMDDEKSHKKFIQKYELPFALLVDTDHAIADAYGSYGEKNFIGKNYRGVLRKTFLIDEAGKIVKVFNQVKVDEHANEVLQAFGE